MRKILENIIIGVGACVGIGLVSYWAGNGIGVLMCHYDGPPCAGIESDPLTAIIGLLSINMVGAALLGVWCVGDIVRDFVKRLLRNK